MTSEIKAISLPKQLLEKAKENADKKDMGFSEYIRWLVVEDSYKENEGGE